MDNYCGMLIFIMLIPLRNRWLRAGVALVIFGWGPLLGIVLLSSLGLWPDPNPNPVGPGLLFFVTFWPAVVCLAIGGFKAHRSSRSNTGSIEG
jgi:hypothetical protein